MVEESSLGVLPILKSYNSFSWFSCSFRFPSNALEFNLTPISRGIDATRAFNLLSARHFGLHKRAILLEIYWTRYTEPHWTRRVTLSSND